MCRREEMEGNLRGEDLLREGGVEERWEAFLKDAEGCN
jgi:hypothetical protein